MNIIKRYIGTIPVNDGTVDGSVSIDFNEDIAEIHIRIDKNANVSNFSDINIKITSNNFTLLDDNLQSIADAMLYSGQYAKPKYISLYQATNIVKLVILLDTFSVIDKVNITITNANTTYTVSYTIITVSHIPNSQPQP